jgi:hypothetical protein
MPQIILHPNDPALGCRCPPPVLPPWVREFGKLPNVDYWKAGDLILVSSLTPDFTQRAIKTVQERGGYHVGDAQWHHAAVYLGDYALCEATKTGVKAGKIYPYIGNHLIRVRRDISLTDDLRWKIAIQSLLRLEFSYSSWSIAKIWWQSRVGFWNDNFKPQNTSKRAVICSQLYADAYGSVTDKTVEEKDDIPVTPAQLSVCTLFQDVQTHWLTIQ